MSQEHVEIVRRVWKRVTARLEMPHELSDPNWELDIRDVSAEVVGVVRGSEATEAMRPCWETFEAFHVELREWAMSEGTSRTTRPRPTLRTQQVGAVI